MTPKIARFLAQHKPATPCLVLDVDRSPERVLRDALADIERVEAELAEVAAQAGGSPREVLARLAQDAPTDDTIVELARQAMAAATEFVQERDLITLYPDPVEVIVMPEIHRGVAVAYCDAPGALDRDLVLFGELVHPEDGDDVLERLVALQDLLDLPCHRVMLVTDYHRRKHA